MYLELVLGYFQQEAHFCLKTVNERAHTTHGGVGSGAGSCYNRFGVWNRESTAKHVCTVCVLGGKVFPAQMLPTLVGFVRGDRWWSNEMRQ